MMQRYFKGVPEPVNQDETIRIVCVVSFMRVGRMPAGDRAFAL